MTVIDVLAARASDTSPAYTFLVDGDSDSQIQWTFAETARNSRTFTARLRAAGIGAGDRVVLALNPSLEYIAALYGIMALGAVPVPCFPPLRSKELDRFHAITLDCAPEAIVIDEMFSAPIELLQSRLRPTGLDPTILYPADVQDGNDGVEPVPLGPDELALIQYTSGSTGAPKGVCLTHDNLVSNCEALGRSMGDDPGRIGFTWLPPYHDMGLMGTIILSMFHGWPLVLMSPMHFIQDPLRWLRAITDYRVTITVGPNFSLDLCATALDDGDATGLDLSTVKELYCGAEPISAETLERFVKAMAPWGFDPNAVIPCYGMAEATLFVAGKSRGTRYRTGAPVAPADSGGDVVSCGTVDSEHCVRIVDPISHTHVDDGRVGEIWIRGRSVAGGYYNRIEQTAEVFHGRLADEDGLFLRTGDLGFTRGGELFVTGRIKDLIIVNGRNIYPQDIEAAVAQADSSFRRAVAFSIPGEGSEQLGVVAEVEQPDLSAQAYSTMVETIRSNVTSRFGIRPHVHICPKRTIPTTTSGKVRRRETRQMFLADALRSVQIDTPEIHEATT